MPTPAPGSSIDIFFVDGEAYSFESPVTFASEVATQGTQWTAVAGGHLIQWMSRASGTVVIQTSGGGGFTGSNSTQALISDRDTTTGGGNFARLLAIDDHTVKANTTDPDGLTLVLPNGATFSPGTTNNIGHAFDSSASSLCANGGPVNSGGPLTAETAPNEVNIGVSVNGDWVFQGTIVRLTTYDDSNVASLASRTSSAAPPVSGVQSFVIACGDETTPTTVGAGKVTLRLPYPFNLTEVRASLTVAQTSGSTFTVDIKESGTSILATKITIDNTATTSTTATVQPQISTSALADDAQITIDVVQVGNGSAAGLKVALVGTQS